ncbi:MAG: hypothetical protein K2L13_03650 [Opitutales bacterium]|nr:hypothetical protein [Opitutales bacterium]
MTLQNSDSYLTTPSGNTGKASDDFKFVVPNNPYKSGKAATNIFNNNIGIDFIKWMSGSDDFIFEPGSNEPKIATSISVPQDLESLGAARNLLDNLAGDSGNLQTCALGDVLENFLMLKSTPSEEEQDAIAEELTDKIIEKFSVPANVTLNQAGRVSTIRSGDLLPVGATKAADTSSSDVNDGSDAVLDALTAFVNDDERLKNSSPEELMAALVISLLLILQKQRELQGENRWKVKEIASNMVKMTFEFKKTAAEETKKSAQIQAIGQMVSGCISIATGVFGAFAGFKGLKAGSTSTTASGAVNQQAVANAGAWNALSQAVSQFGRGLGEMSTAIAGYLASKHTYKANIAEANAGITQSVGQSQNDTASNNQSNIRDTKQHMDSSVSLLKEIIKTIFDANMSVIKNNA